MKTKICFKCKKEKPITEFYKHKQMADGYLNKCRECTKKDVSNKYQENIAEPAFVEKERKRGRQKYHRLYTGTGKANKERGQRWISKYPEKTKAKNYTQHLKKPFEGAESHHWSYNENHYKDVIWLSKKQHMKGHRFIIYDQERKMYRRYDTNELLDTKELHELFIRWCIENKED